VRAAVPLALAATLLLAPPLCAAPVVTEFPICTAAGHQQKPQIDGNIVVWTEYPDGDVYGYDLSTGVLFPVCTAPTYQKQADVSGHMVVWYDGRNGNFDIYGYDLNTTTEFPICTDPARQVRCRISGDIVVWEDDRAYGSHIYAKKLSTGSEFAVCIDPGDQRRPDIADGVVVWDTAANSYLDHDGTGDIYGFDLATGTQFPVCTAPGDQISPRISGSIVVWQDERGGWTRDIYGYDLTTEREFPICTGPGACYVPAVDSNLVVWEDNRSGARGVYGFDIATSTEFPICLDTEVERDKLYVSIYPVVSGDTVVWHDYRDGNWDIYGATINRPPTTPDVAITPAHPAASDKLHCNASGSVDPEGAAVTYKYKWWRNGVLQPACVWPNVAAWRTSHGDTWRCVVTPSDGTLDGPPAEASVIINRPPGAPTVSITPAHPTTDNKLHCEVSESTDPDGDSLTYRYQWYKNGVIRPVRTWPNIAAWRTSPGDEWRCVVTPTDGMEDGPTAEATVVINRPPTAPTVTITPASPATDDTLHCDASASTDADGDSVTYRYQWYKNGVIRPARIWPNVAAWRTSPGDEWRCVVTPTDGKEDGPTGEDTVTIEGSSAVAETLAVSGLVAQPTAAGAQMVFTLSADANVIAEVMNIAGRSVRVVLSERPMASGTNTLVWDGRNSAGLKVPAGTYIVRVRAADAAGAQSQALRTLQVHW